MPTRAMYVYFLVACFMGCHHFSRDPVREFIPGTYERRINNEFSKGRDQLTIHFQQGNVYTIKKISAITRIRNGVKLPLRRDTAVWTGIYDQEDRVIYEQQKGKVLSFQPEENKLLVGGSVYRKVK